jgi:hypothetical protein
LHGSCHLTDSLVEPAGDLERHHVKAVWIFECQPLQELIDAPPQLSVFVRRNGDSIGRFEFRKTPPAR